MLKHFIDLTRRKCQEGLILIVAYPFNERVIIKNLTADTCFFREKTHKKRIF